MANIKHAPTENPVIDRIEELLLSQKKKKKELLAYIGARDSSYTSWRYSNGESYLKYIDKIANFLGVNSAYLLTGNVINEDSIKVSQTELDLIRTFRQLPEPKKNSILQIAKLLLT